MVLFYVVAVIGIVLGIIYLTLGTASFLRIRRELLAGNDIGVDDTTPDPGEVSLVSGFGWKASLAVATSFVVLVISSFSGNFWYVLAVSGLGTAVAVIAAFVLELRGDRRRAVVS